MRAIPYVTVVLLLVLAGGCREQPPEVIAPPAGSPDPATQQADARTVVGVGVQIFGSVHALMMEGRTEERVRLQDVATDPAVYGLGALSDLRGEVTIIAGESWLAWPNGEAPPRVVSTREPTEGATLLVVAEVKEWTRLELGDEVAMPELGARLRSLANERGWDGEGVLPFVIEGPVRGLMWHVIDGARIPKDERGHEAHLRDVPKHSLESERATLFGFYSTEHMGVFTHRGATVHAHVVDPAQKASGHVDGGTIAAGATLRLPASPATP